ncbi:hypothetical protein [Agrococcus citreus]|uniref:Uncharacterized protein n=1 Tax=Agrococcus citreus TaxID=84643 RepID=A0ABP4JIN4_9MICO
MRTAIPLLLAAVAIGLAGCSAPASSPAPTGAPVAEPTASAPAPSASESPTTAAAETPAPQLVVSTPGPVAGAPRCGDGVVLAAAMVEPDSPSAASWLEASAARAGFEPSALLDDAAVLCAITFEFEPDGAQATVESSTAYVRGDDVEAAVQAWATTSGYARDDQSGHPQRFVLGEASVPTGSLEAIRLDSTLLGANDLAWHEQSAGFELEATDWVVTRSGSLP